MKLSPAKIDQLVDELLDLIAETEGVLLQGNDGQLKLAMKEIITNELMVEELLDAEIHKMLQQHKYEITMGRLSYDDLFRKTKNRLIADRKIIL
jgi:hypothetical protein